MTEFPGTDPGEAAGLTCPSCGERVTSSQRFCAACGTALSADPVPLQPSADEDYPEGHKVAAAVLAVVAPFISLVAALVLRSSQQSPTRRATLRTWAIASGAWLALGLVVVIIVAAAAAHSVSVNTPSTSGPCVGGPDMGSSGVPVGHGKYRFPCAGGGSTVVHIGQ